jgi:signal transduction histidine kinase/CheY-like chemotaxis protein
LINKALIMTKEVTSSLALFAMDALRSRVVVLDKHGCIRHTNFQWRAFADANGTSGAEYGVGENYLAVCDAASGCESEGALEMAIGIRSILQGDIDHFETEYPCSSNIAKDWFIVKANRFIHDGQIHILIAHEDITDQKKLLKYLDGEAIDKRKRIAELEHAQLAAEAATLSKSEFLATMSHEIRTPLNSVLGLLELLKRSDLNESQRNHVSNAKITADYSITLLGDILDFSKVEAGKMALDLKPFVISELVDELKTILSANLQDKPLGLHFDVDPSLPAIVIGDAKRLKQVLINLGANAVKFTAQGQVCVSVSLQQIVGDNVELTFKVSDTGIGLSPEQQGLIFESFVQADVSTSQHYGGSGLGLAISQRLTMLMGSKLKVQSELGVGSTFYFALSLRLPKDIKLDVLKPVAAKPALAMRVKPLERWHVLFVEDNPMYQNVLQMLLEDDGAQVTLAPNGHLAVNALKIAPNAFDMVLMDMDMPVMDGLQATRYIRQQLKLTELPIIAMTGNVMASAPQDCLDAGMNCHIGKPFKFEDLIALMLLHKQCVPLLVAPPRHRTEAA